MSSVPARAVASHPDVPSSLVIDTDTASDDAIALVQALRAPSARVRAITTVAGNVPVDTATTNALLMLDLVDAPAVPVHRGCTRPMQRALETAQAVHGMNGMSDIMLPGVGRAAADVHAVEALLAIARDEPGQHDLVTLGPLTNIAVALMIEPRLLTAFRHTYMMLGAPDGRGNVTATGEYNAWADPEAASNVLEAPGEKTMIGWDLSRRFAVMRPEDDERLLQCGDLGAFAVRINQAVRDWDEQFTGVGGYDLPDPLAMAVVLEAGIVRGEEKVHLKVSTEGATRGQTVVDWRPVAPPPNVRVITDVDEAQFKQHLFAAFTR